MRFLVIFISLLSISVTAKLDLTKKQFIIHKKDADRLSLKASSEDFVKKEIYEVDGDIAEDFVREMSSRSDVVEVEENILLNYLSEQDDPLFDQQWSLQEFAGGISIKRAWEFTKGKNDIVVAIIDSGVILDHEDIRDRLVQGADFVSDVFIANDGDGRDMDPSDPGNWNFAGECGAGSSSKPSNWHGTHVAGIVGSAHNDFGVVGVAPNVSILPIRAMGKCGGRLNDVADAIRWAAGAAVSGMPTNQNPAKVINLSLGGFGSCGSTMQNAINDARSRGATVIVAVGNESLNLDRYEMVPVSCRGVVNVASNDANGKLSSFSNYGVEVDVVAPGGFQGGMGILNLGNSGNTSPSNNNYVYKVGTSMSAPHVAGIAALIYSLKEDLYPDQIEQILKDTALEMSSGGTGFGIVQAYDSLVLTDSDSIQPDPDFKTDEPFVNRQNASVPNFGTSYTEDVAACGSVVLQSGGGGSGPGGNFMASLFIGIAMITLSRKTKILSIKKF